MSVSTSWYVSFLLCIDFCCYVFVYMYVRVCLRERERERETEQNYYFDFIEILRLANVSMDCESQSTFVRGKNFGAPYMEFTETQ